MHAQPERARELCVTLEVKNKIGSIRAGVTPPVAPTPTARKLVRYLLGFGVGVAVGLAPFLGVLRIPLFAPLLDLIPRQVQSTLIPLSAALMGMVAVVVQWYGGVRVNHQWLHRKFIRGLVFSGVMLVVLIVVHTQVVVAVPILGGEYSVTFLVGFSRPVRPPCTEDVSDAECIKLISLDPSLVESFWGDRQVRLARLALMMSYLLFTSSFGALIGLIILREGLEAQKKQRHLKV